MGSCLVTTGHSTTPAYHVCSAPVPGGVLSLPPGPQPVCGEPCLCCLPATHLPPWWESALPAPLCQGHLPQLLPGGLLRGEDLRHQSGQLRELRDQVRHGVPPRLLRGPGDYLC